jgi:hypothetical protein
LDADRFRRDGSVSWSWHGQNSAGTSGDLQEFTAIYVQSHALLLLPLVFAFIRARGAGHSEAM